MRAAAELFLVCVIYIVHTGEALLASGTATTQVTCYRCCNGWISTDNANCNQDIDECRTLNGGCAHNCYNTHGSFTCSCRAEYALAPNKKSCNDTGVIINTRKSTTSIQKVRKRAVISEHGECARTNGGCEQRCISILDSFLCGCLPGYRLNSDKKTCSDDNECSRNNGGCSHTCTNTIGSYECSCPVVTHRLDTDKHRCQDPSFFSECTVGHNGMCTCPSNLHLLHGTSYCADSCFPDPCKHHGVCSVAGPDYLCDCSNTGYIGSECETGIITFSTSDLIVDIHEQSNIVSLTAYPETELVLTASSSGSVIKVIPSSIILQTPETHTEFKVLAEMRGVHELYLTPSGRDSSSFNEETLRVTVQDVFSKFSPGRFKLPRGCFYLSSFTCPHPGRPDMLFQSTSPWYQLDTDANVRYTFGISFIEEGNFSLPISLTGMEVHSNPSTHSFTLIPVGSARQVADGTMITDIRDNGCIEVPLTNKDIHTFLNTFTMFKDVILTLYDRLPPWVRLTPKHTPYIQKTALWTRVLYGHKVQQIPSCHGAPLYDDTLYHVFRFSEGTQLSVMSSEITLPDLSPDNEYCLIIDLCHDYGTTLVLMLPPEAAVAVQQINILSNLKDNAGIEIIPAGIGLSLTSSLNVARSVTELELWNGDEIFNYNVMADANIWVTGSLQKRVDSSKSGFAVSGDTELFIRLPNLKQFFNEINLDEWNILLRHSDSFEVQLMLKVFGNIYTLGPLHSELSTYTHAYASLEGDYPRLWCGSGANPPGIFGKFDLEARIFQGIPVLENVLIRTEVVAYGFIIFDELGDPPGLSQTQLYNDLLTLLKNKVGQTWTFIQGQLNQILPSVKQLLNDALLELKDSWLNFVDLIQSAIDKIEKGKLPSLSILGDIANMLTAIGNIFDKVKSNSLMQFESAADEIISHLETSLGDINPVIEDLIMKASSETNRLISGNHSFGIKARMTLTLFGWQFPDIGGELVYSDTSLSHCSKKYQYAYTELQGAAAYRIYGEFVTSAPIFKFFSIHTGHGLEIALATESPIWVYRFHARWVFFSLQISSDVFINTRGLYATKHTNIFNLFRVSLTISADVTVPMNELTLLVIGEFLAGGDDSFQGSFLDALRKQSKKLGDAAADRILQAQEASSSAQRKLTNAQDWLEQTKSELYIANEVFDSAVAALNNAREKLESAKGPFTSVNDKLKAAQVKVNRLCNINSCGNKCVPGLKCRICHGVVDYPCCDMTDCMTRITDPVCEASNAACRAVRAVAFTALEAAKFAIKAPLLALDGAKALVSTAEVVVDKSRVILEFAKLPFSDADALLEGAKIGLEVAKGALEAVKLIVREDIWLFNYTLEHGLSNIIDIKRCGFAVEISVASVFEFEVYCEVDIFSLGWSTVRFKVNFRSILQSLGNAAISVINRALHTLGIARRRRDLAFMEYKQRTNLRYLYRNLRSDPDEVANLNISAADADRNNIDMPLDNSTIDLKDSARFSTDRCTEFRSLSSYLNLTTDILRSTSSAIVDQLATLRNMAQPVIPDISSLIKSMTAEIVGINMTEAFQEYNLTEQDVNDVIVNSGQHQNETITELTLFYEVLSAQHKEKIRTMENFNVIKMWREGMITMASQSFTNEVCIGFEDCLIHAVTRLEILYDHVAEDDMSNTHSHLSEISKITRDLISKESWQAESIMAVSERLLELLSLLDGDSKLCGSVPVILVSPENATALRGMNVSMQCQASSAPIPIYKWFKDNDDSKIVSTLATLQITSINSNDEGQYTCRASNHVGFTEATAALRVEYPPMLKSVFQKQFDLLLGESLHLECRADAKPDVSFQWFSSGIEIPIPNHANLNLENVTPSSAGLYKCEARNTQGVNVSTEISVQVYEGSIACPLVAITIRYGHKLYMGQTLFSAIPGDLTTRFTEAFNNIISLVPGVLIKQVKVVESSQMLEIILTHDCNNRIAIIDDTVISAEFQKRRDVIYKAIALVSTAADNNRINDVVLFRMEGDGYQLIAGSLDFDVDTTNICQAGYRSSTIRDKLCISDIPDVTVGLPRNLAMSGLLLSWDTPVKGSDFIKEYEVKGVDMSTNEAIAMRVPRAPASLVGLFKAKQIEVAVRAITESNAGEWISIEVSLYEPSIPYCVQDMPQPHCRLCTVGQKHAHQVECNSYYQCIPPGELVKRYCLPGFQFESAISACNLESMVLCRDVDALDA